VTRAVLLIGVLALTGATSAAADTAHLEGSYAGSTDAAAKVSFKVPPASPRQVRRFSIGYTSECSDGERLRSTFRFYPAAIAKDRFAITGATSGTLADGRAFRSSVRLGGRFPNAGLARGSFRLVTRIPDPTGAVATCRTGLIRWTAARR
jgi:hypothetical protein